MGTSARQGSPDVGAPAASRTRRLRTRQAVVALVPVAVLLGCSSPPLLADAKDGSNVSVCAAVTAATRKIAAQDEQPTEIRDGAAQIREAAARADDQALVAAGNAYAQAALDYADAVASGDPAIIVLRRGDLERQTPRLGDACGLSYDNLLTI